MTEFRHRLLDILDEDARRGRDPFLDRLAEGSVSPAALRVWAQQYFLVVREFTRFLGGIYANCPEWEVREILAMNLYEEHGRFIPGKDHPSLLRKFGRRVGSSDDAMNEAAPLAGTSEYLDVLFRLTREGTWLEGLAAVALGVEFLVPRHFARLERLFHERYGFSADDTEFFRVHIEDDEMHGRRALDVIVKLARDPEQQARVVSAVRQAQEGRRRFREALYRACLAPDPNQAEAGAGVVASPPEPS